MGSKQSKLASQQKANGESKSPLIRSNKKDLVKMGSSGTSRATITEWLNVKDNDSCNYSRAVSALGMSNSSSFVQNASNRSGAIRSNAPSVMDDSDT